MITLSDTAKSALTRSFTYRIMVESWRGSELLSDNVPVVSATEEGKRDSRVPELVTLTVPRVDRGFSWSPVSDDHPLAANGQRLRIQLGIDIGNGQTEWFQRGWFVITDSETNGDTVTVRAAGLLYLIDEARLVSPFQPSGNLVGTLRGLVEPALTVVVDAGLPNRSVPSGINYDEDRLGAVLELLDGWPADAYVTEDGYLLVTSATQSTTPVLTLTNGEGGTIISASGASTRDGAYNVVVARGTAADGGQVQGVAYNRTGNSAKSLDGPFNPLPVPYYYSSPLLTTVNQCNAAARTVLARLQRSTSKEFAVEMVPNPAVQLGDVVSVTTDDYANLLCSVEALALPLTPETGAQKLTVRSLT